MMSHHFTISFNCLVNFSFILSVSSSAILVQSDIDNRFRSERNEWLLKIDLCLVLVLVLHHLNLKYESIWWIALLNSISHILFLLSLVVEQIKMFLSIKRDGCTTFLFFLCLVSRTVWATNRKKQKHTICFSSNNEEHSIRMTNSCSFCMT